MNQDEKDYGWIATLWGLPWPVRALIGLTLVGGVIAAGLIFK